MPRKCRGAPIFRRLRKFEVTGPDAEALLQYCLTRDIRKLSTGQVVYTAMCYENGGMIDDGTVFRLGQNNFRWIGGDDFSGIWLRQQAEKMGYKAWVRSSTDQLHNIAVQGPKSRDLLKEIIWTAPAQPAIGELEWFRFAVARIGHFEGPPIVVSRTGYTGELGYEIFCHPKDALAVFDAVWEAGQKYGLKPMGLEALDMVRIEAGLIFANYEFTSETDPFEAGIGFTVPLKTKTDDFIGKQALIQRKEHPRHKLVGLEIDSNEAVGHGDCVSYRPRPDRRRHQRMRSPILGKNIALARVDVLHSEIGTEVEIGKLDGHAEAPARPGSCKFAHYDPEKTAGQRSGAPSSGACRATFSRKREKCFHFTSPLGRRWREAPDEGTFAAPLPNQKGPDYPAISCHFVARWRGRHRRRQTSQRSCRSGSTSSRSDWRKPLPSVFSPINLPSRATAQFTAPMTAANSPSPSRWAMTVTLCGNGTS